MSALPPGGFLDLGGDPPNPNGTNLLELAETSVWDKRHEFSKPACRGIDLWLLLTGTIIDGLERHRAQLATIDTDNAHVVDFWLATCFLVGLLPMAVEVFDRSRGNLAHRPTPDGVRLLRAYCDRPAQPDRANIWGDHRARAALFIPGASYRLCPLQSAVCGAALYSSNFDGRPAAD